MPSKGEIDRAGALLRTWWGSDDADINDAVMAAFDTIWDYRKAFQYPLTMVNAGLRYYVKKSGSEVFIAQRLKRLPRVLDKLQRHPKMRLTQMQDVGGCRAILPDHDAVQRVLKGIENRWDIITVDDYVGH